MFDATQNSNETLGKRLEVREFSLEGNQGNEERDEDEVEVYYNLPDLLPLINRKELNVLQWELLSGPPRFALVQSSRVPLISIIKISLMI